MVLCLDCGRSFYNCICLPVKAPVSESPSVTGLGADADYAYKDIAEFEEIVDYKVNAAFRAGWSMARTTNKQLRILAGEEEGP